MKRTPLAVKLRALRNRAGLLPKDVVTLTDGAFSEAALRQWEYGTRIPTFECMMALARVYGVPVEALEKNTAPEEVLTPEEIKEFGPIEPDAQPPPKKAPRAAEALFTVGMTTPLRPGETVLLKVTSVDARSQQAIGIVLGRVIQAPVTDGHETVDTMGNR